ncbi:hypothetical protein PG985_010988 [Apiospora marii]|uniref:Mid2 domain-containing protein n=1 Tax=Apiospora marii TaxID=335849 RepID=A0ABR1SSD9_9PEZI
MHILLIFSITALGELVFVNPAQKFEGDAVDFATNPVHPVGSSLTVEWASNTDLKEPISLLLFQNNSPPENAEHIFRNVSLPSLPSKKGSWKWTVVTNQTLDHSHVFSLSLFFEGKENPEAISREFNITASGNGSASQSPLSTSNDSINSSVATSSNPATSTASLSTSATPSNSDSGLSGEQKLGLSLGLGLGIPLSALLGICCFFLWRLLNRLKNDKEQRQDHVTGGDYGAYMSGDKYSRNGDDDIKTQQQHEQEATRTGELQSTPLCEVETPPNDSEVQRARRGPAELGDYEGFELRA